MCGGGAQAYEEQLTAVLRNNDNLVKELERLDTIGSMLQYQVRRAPHRLTRAAAASNAMCGLCEQVTVAEDTIKETQESLENFRHLVRCDLQRPAQRQLGD